MRLPLALAVAACAAVLVAPGANAGFPAGQCTTWAFMMRPEIVAESMLGGQNVNWNADQWATNAQSLGFPVGTTPKVGAIAVWPAHVLGAGPVGHVAYVQKVRSDGSFYVSEEDYNGNPAVHYRWIAPTTQLQFVYLEPGEKVPSGPIKPGGQIESLSSTGMYTAATLAQTSVKLSVNAATNIAFRLTGPGIDHTVRWNVPSGTWTVGLDKIAGASSLPAGTYKVTVFAYTTQVALRWLTFQLT
jgi:hypothetical protein